MRSAGLGSFSCRAVSTVETPSVSIAMRVSCFALDLIASDVTVRPLTTTTDNTAEATSVSIRLIPRINVIYRLILFVILTVHYEQLGNVSDHVPGRM